MSAQPDDLVERLRAWKNSDLHKAGLRLACQEAARRIERDAATIAALREYASHLEWCRSCAEDSVGSCAEGAQLQAAAGMARAAIPSPDGAAK